MIERRDLASNNNDDLAEFAPLYACAVCRNPKVNEDIIRLLFEYFPAAVFRRTVVNVDPHPPLYYAIANPNVTLNVVKLLLDQAPDTVRYVDTGGYMPLHYLCYNKRLDKTVGNQILELLIEKCQAVRHVGNDGDLPIHLAVEATKSPNFCRILIEAYPGSERIHSSKGWLPLHLACLHNNVSTVKYLYKVYPDAINHASTDRMAARIYPIHYAIGRDDPVVWFRDCQIPSGLRSQCETAEDIQSYIHASFRLPEGV